MKLLKIMLFVSLCLFFTSVFALKPELLCVHTNYEFIGDNLLLKMNGNKHLVFLFHNISDKSFIINPILSSPGASAGYTSVLNGNNWSALNVGRDLNLSCAIQNNERIRYVPCNQVLQICHYPPLQFPTKHEGDFWVAEDKTRNEIILAVQNYRLKSKN